MCESRGGRPGLPVPPNSPYDLCGRKATLNLNKNDSPHSAYCSHLPSDRSRSRISQANMVGLSLLSSSILATTPGVATLGLLPPMLLHRTDSGS